jgi:hypothetical protein
MKIVTFCPYGSLSEEAGLLFLLGAHLQAENHSVQYLQCNGAFSLCERDENLGWKRSLESCSLCIGEQAAFAYLSNIEILELSRYLSSRDIVESKRIVSALRIEELSQAEYEGLSLFSLCLPIFQKMFASETVTFLHQKHETIVRGLFLSIIHSYIAGRKLCAVEQPDLALVADGTDMITSPFLRALEQEKVDAVTIKWQKQDNTIKIFRRNCSKSINVDFFVEITSLITMPQEKWPSEVLEQLLKIRRYLGLTEFKPSVQTKRSFFS